ncbi:MAG: hypothetical protein F4086_19485, partial [Gemmatimonadetes bacterium]|nr:hypothetical protein [Gemmatimonadota bacterium]
MTAKPPLWTPSRGRTRASNLAGFAAWLAEQGGGVASGAEGLAAALNGRAPDDAGAPPDSHD